MMQANWGGVRGYRIEWANAVVLAFDEDIVSIRSGGVNDHVIGTV